jgi:DNA-binding LacI/PurR family transcriptional regulator
MKRSTATTGDRPPTIIDVAKEAKVGVMSVSRVINNHPSVKASTLSKVMRAIAKTGYSPNDAAEQGVRHLIEHGHRKIACVSFDSGSYADTIP